MAAPRLPLFPDEPDPFPATTRLAVVPRFLCHYDPPCRNRPRAEIGEPVDMGGCVNQSIRCTKCGRTGVISTRTVAYAYCVRTKCVVCASTRQDNTRQNKNPRMGCGNVEKAC
jgi:hypothetical protein